MTESEHQALLLGDLGESASSTIPPKGKAGRRVALGAGSHVLGMIPDEKSPLAARMRPHTVDKIVGQDHVLAAGRALPRCRL